MNKLVTADPRVSMDFIVQTLDIYPGVAFKILKPKIGYKKVCKRWVPNLLTQNDKSKQVAYAQRLLHIYENCDQKRLNEIIKGYETWAHYFEPKYKAQNKAWVPKDGNFSIAVMGAGMRASVKSRMLYRLSEKNKRRR